MRGRVTGFCLVATVGLAMAIGAQEPGPYNPSAARAGSAVADAQIKVADEIKATGCLTKDATGGFELTKATVAVAAWYSDKAAKITGGKTAPATSVTTFGLQNGTGLDAHVGHQVEITGIPGAATANVDPTPDTIGGRGGTGGIVPKSVARFKNPQINVKAVKMIATSCS
jgi:hypothetical protein